MSAELSFFILRSQAISLYRRYLREIRLLPQPTKGELHGEIRRGFEQHKHVRDLYAIKYNLSDGRTRLGQLQTMFAFTK
ncbi:hypothetical protein DUNSADRAFT_14601 [Dunaliella salina]|uniref:Complex 1 LYR protein domain-containing protein n=1 Tax=Dunaliella salina TaxID=3046 RepID=A0ABQ7H2G2_DUNSA|nr:hypothetical protein DUNSADRAFT_14601 [Dunaliella salina]|eukprot:KAF5841043.1 hypothetical protein DUNSADRAFT_14601 [Dunaliella salina]